MWIVPKGDPNDWCLANNGLGHVTFQLLSTIRKSLGWGEEGNAVLQKFPLSWIRCLLRTHFEVDILLVAEIPWHLVYLYLDFCVYGGLLEDGSGGYRDTITWTTSFKYTGWRPREWGENKKGKFSNLPTNSPVLCRCQLGILQFSSNTNYLELASNLQV